jgi:hypothetical protein
VGQDEKDAADLLEDASLNEESGDAGEELGDEPPAPGCDLTGPWLITERLIASGLGAQQAAIYWLYYELEQSGEKLRVAKGLVCGTVVQPVGSISASVDMHGSWPKLMEKNPHTGRAGVSKPTKAGCSVSMTRAPYVFGATMPYYQDDARALPGLDQAASGSSPGWEDWDADDQPGITMRVSGLANGIRYSTARTSSAWSGQIKSGAQLFKLFSVWQQVESVLGVTSEILKAMAVRDADPTLHFAQFARLEKDQVSGNDAAICKQIRELAPMLTAEANK